MVAARPVLRAILAKRVLRAIRVLVARLEIRVQQEALVPLVFPVPLVLLGCRAPVVFQDRVDRRVFKDNVETQVQEAILDQQALLEVRAHRANLVLMGSLVPLGVLVLLDQREIVATQDRTVMPDQMVCLFGL